VELDFDKGAIEAIADLAMERGTGARGLRSIMEESLLQTMYEIPSRDDVAKVVVTKPVVLEGTLPKLVKKTPKEKSA